MRMVQRDVMVLGALLCAAGVGAQQYEVARIEPDVPQLYAHFGSAVDIDGTTLVVGAPDDPVNGDAAGAAYIFERGAWVGEWTQVARLEAVASDPEDHFGYAVAVDGDTVAVGSWGDDFMANAAGLVYVFERDIGGPNAWGAEDILWADDAQAGDALGRAVTDRNFVSARLSLA